MKILSKSYKNGVLSFLMASLVLFTACTNNSKDKGDENTEVVKEGASDDTEWQVEEETLSLQEQVDLLVDSLQNLKSRAFASEEQKQNSAQLLLDEIDQSIPSHDTNELKSLRELHQTMVAAVYTESSLASEDAMLKYDEATGQFIEALQNFINNTPDFQKHARAKLLYNEVKQADGQDFLIRKDYNNYAQELNNLLNTKKDEIQALGEKYQQLQNVPLFYGEPIPEV